MNGFTADTASMRTKAQQLTALAEEYDALRNRLLKTSTSMGSIYQSSDSNVFEGKITEFCAHLQEVSSRLRNAAQVITTQANNYDRTDSENAGQASRLPY